MCRGLGKSFVSTCLWPFYHILPQEVLLHHYFVLFIKHSFTVRLSASTSKHSRREAGRSAEPPNILPWWHLQTPPTPPFHSADTPSTHCRSATQLSISTSRLALTLSVTKTHTHTQNVISPTAHCTTEPCCWASETAQRREKREIRVWCPPVPEEAACQLGKARWKQSHMMAAEETAAAETEVLVWAGRRCW